MLRLKSCPKCTTGDLYKQTDSDGDYLSCIQCGYVESLPSLYDRLETDAAGNHVLLIGDRAFERALSAICEKLGCRLTAFADPEDSFRFLERNRAKLAIVDAQPHLVIDSLMTTLRTTFLTPVAVMVWWWYEEQLPLGRLANYVLHKPPRQAEVELVLRRLISLPSRSPLPL